MTRYTFLFCLPILFLTGIFTACQTETASDSDVEPIELQDFETVVSVEDNLVGVPSMIRYGDSTLYVFDKMKGAVVAIDRDGRVTAEFGRRGRGPGEFQRVSNMMLTGEYLFLVDEGQYLIHKYDLSGAFISSMDYGRLTGLSRPNVPAAPVAFSDVYAENINNRPYVTMEGNVLLSTARFSDSLQSVYELRNWDGTLLAEIGAVPEGSSFVIDYEALRDEIIDRKVPAFYRSNVFPVEDRENPGEFFLVYSAFPKITKYNSEGDLLWEKPVPETAEIDSVSTHFYESMERMQQTDIRSRIILEYFTAGSSSPDGELFLAIEQSSLWIHRYGSEGELISRFLLRTGDVGLTPIFDIDSAGRKIFVVSEEAEIRAYSY